jgi:hypothetical protein
MANRDQTAFTEEFQMTSATCETIPPEGPTIEDGSRVYRCANMVTTFNETELDILYNVEATMSDSFGHSVTTSAINVVSPARVGGVSGPYFADFDAGTFNEGDEVVFTCQLAVTGGFSVVDRRQKTSDSFVTRH